MRATLMTIGSAVLCLAAGLAAGAPVTWTGSGTASWNDTNNWSTLALPGPSDTAVFTDAGLTDGATLALDATQHVGAVDLGGSRRFTIGAAADITAGNRLQLSSLTRANVTASMTNTIAADVILDAAETVITPGSSGMLYLTGYLQDGTAANALVVQGPGVCHHILRTESIATSISAFDGGTIVKGGAELRIWNRGTGNPQASWFGTGAITLTNGTLAYLDAGGSNGGIWNNIIVNGVGTVASSHTYPGRSCSVYGSTYLNGVLTLTGGLSLTEGAGVYTGAGANLYVNQDGAGVRRIVQHATAVAPERAWGLGQLKDSAGGAGNELQLQNLSEAGTRFYVMGASSDNQGGIHILDDGVPENLLTFANAIESTAKLNTSAGRLGRSAVVVDPGALLVLRYNRDNETRAFTYYGVYPDKPLTANGTVFIGKRGTKFGTTNDFALATMGSLSGTGRVVLCHARLLVGNDNGHSSFGGTLEDDPHINLTGITNALVKLGSGVFTLAGAASHTGGTRVDGGTLRLDGSLAHATMTIASGATLDGAGTLTVHVSGLTTESIACTGTINIASMTLNVIEDSPATGDYYVLADCTAGTVIGERFAASSNPLWGSVVRNSRVLITRRLGTIVSVR